MTEVKKIENIGIKKGKRFTKDQFLVVVSLLCTIATVVVLFSIMRKNAPSQVVVGDLEKKAKVTVKKVDWKKL